MLIYIARHRAAVPPDSFTRIGHSTSYKGRHRAHRRDCSDETPASGPCPGQHCVGRRAPVPHRVGSNPNHTYNPRGLKMDLNL